MASEATDYRETTGASRWHVLYEDNHLIAVFKPAGMLTQGDASGDPCLMDHVKAFLREKYRKPGEVFLGLLHRIDRPVAGIVLFAKTSKGASRMSEQIREHAVEKIYRAVVEGVPATRAARLRHWLGDSEGLTRVRIADGASAGLKPATLYYETVEAKDGATLLEISLETGRKHQIRAQLARVGHPIRGDRRYGAIEDDRGAIALVAHRLRFRHPVRKDEVVDIEVPPQLGALAKWW